MLPLSETFSGLSAVISCLAFLQSKQAQRGNEKLQRENLNLQERMLQIEEARENDRLVEGKTAKLIARIAKGDMPGAPSHLVIENRGQSEARNIQTTINGESIDFYGGISSRSVPVVPAEETFSFTIVNTSDLPDYFHVKMTWTDDSGKPGLFKATLPT